MEEIWKDVYHEGVYVGKKISSLGRLMGDNGLIYAQADNGAGYKFYNILHFRNEEGKSRSVRRYVHRLVAEYFIDNPDSLPQVNHTDGDKSNNRVDNLEWTSGSQNIRLAHKAGQMRNRTDAGDVDILTVEQVIDLYTAIKRDKVGISAKARELGIPRTTASSIVNKRSRSYITDAIDDYLLTDNVVYDRNLTREDLGFGANQNLYRIHEKPRSDSSSGIIGVYTYIAEDKYPMWYCVWPLGNGKMGSKHFSVGKFGDEGAKQKAISYREEMMKQVSQH
jgi:hypothetical protein